MKSLTARFVVSSLLLAISGCGAAGPARPPDIVLIVIDTLRADHLGSFGYGRPTSPVLDALARDGTVFSNATSTSSWTRPAMASLFTGRLPSEAGVAASTDVVDPDLPTVAERLRRVGYQTVGVTGNFVHVNDKSGLSAGFDTFDPVSVPSSEGADVFFEVWGTPVRAPTAPEMNERIFRALDARAEQAGRDPLFLYVHYMDPHSGYMAPESFRERFGPRADGPEATSDYVIEVAAGRVAAGAAERDRLVSLYDAEVAFADDAIGALLAGLEARGIAKHGLVIVVSDHGEEFLDHGGWFHGFTLHREMLHVPLIIRDRRAPAVGRKRAEPVDLIDLSTTLLAAAGVPDASVGPGRDLLGPAPLAPRPRVAELAADELRESRVAPVRHRRALTRWPWKAIVGPKGGIVVYRLDRDPTEESPLTLDDPGVPPALREQARRSSKEVIESAPRVAPEVTPAERRGLRALGYAE